MYYNNYLFNMGNKNSQGSHTSNRKYCKKSTNFTKNKTTIKNTTNTIFNTIWEYAIAKNRILLPCSLGEVSTRQTWPSGRLWVLTNCYVRQWHPARLKPQLIVIERFASRVTSLSFAAF